MHYPPCPPGIGLTRAPSEPPRVCGYPHQPNAETVAAMRELESGRGVRFDSVAELLEELKR
jgi:hypothetical protein